MSQVLGAPSSANSTGSRKMSRARGSTGSRQKRMSRKEKDELNNLQALDYLDAGFNEKDDDVANETFEKIDGSAVMLGDSIVSDFTEAPL